VARFRIQLPEESEEYAQDVCKRVVTVNDGTTVQTSECHSRICCLSQVFEVEDDADVTVTVEALDIDGSVVREVITEEFDSHDLTKTAKKGTFGPVPEGETPIEDEA
jgi:hypothetical protein